VHQSGCNLIYLHCPPKSKQFKPASPPPPQVYVSLVKNLWGKTDYGLGKIYALCVGSSYFWQNVHTDLWKSQELARSHLKIIFSYQSRKAGAPLATPLRTPTLGLKRSTNKFTYKNNFLLQCEEKMCLQLLRFRFIGNFSAQIYIDNESSSYNLISSFFVCGDLLILLSFVGECRKQDLARNMRIISLTSIYWISFQDQSKSTFNREWNLTK
jgi:hypothetical protein